MTAVVTTRRERVDLRANASRSGDRPDVGRLARPRREDFWRYMSADFSPSRVKSIMRAAAQGSPAEQDDAFNRMLEREPHLTSVYNTQLLGLTGLDWEILPATQVGKNVTVHENKRLENGLFSRICGLTNRCWGFAPDPRVF